MDISYKPLTSPTRRKCVKELSNHMTMLSDVVINAYCKILKKSYPNVTGLQDTILSQKRRFRNMMDEQLSIQIHYNGNYHWLCSTYDIKNRQVLLFDSLYNNKPKMELDTQLALLYGTESMQIDVIVPRIQRQNGMFGCGLFALATATCIAAGIDPMHSK